MSKSEPLTYEQEVALIVESYFKRVGRTASEIPTDVVNRVVVLDNLGRVQDSARYLEDAVPDVSPGLLDDVWRVLVGA